jgi:hypothetical protein
MEVWKDFQTGKYYSIDPKTGCQSPSNRYGCEQTTFKTYSTGFPRIINSRPVPIDKLYSVQPSKFDGYCQFPRPSDKIVTKSPYVRTSIKTSKIHIKDESKIPKPLKFLDMSQTSTKGFTNRSSSPLFKLNTTDVNLTTITEFKKSLQKKPLKELKTANELTVKLQSEKNNSKGYVQPVAKPTRRKLKNFFLKNFRTSGELFVLSKKMYEITNPSLFQKLKQAEMHDRAILEKKVKATRLMQNI